MDPYPLCFQPVVKRIIWGGRRLGKQLGKPIGDGDDYAESWEVVDHGDDQSVVANGCLLGKSLAEVLSDHGAWLMGQGHLDHPSFPLLLKYLDCNRVLSVQVHPDDTYGKTMSPPDLGKTEAWYVVDADEESLIYAGLKSGVDRETFRAAIAAGRIEETLHSFHPNPGDIVFVPAGTVHALGAGLLVAEIQQSSNTTFRLFDWNRLGADGKPRQLHLEQGIAVTDFAQGPVRSLRANATLDGWQNVVRCDKFVLQILEKGCAQVAGDDLFHIVTVPRGSASLKTGHEAIEMNAGSTVLLPASMPSCEIEAKSNSCVFSTFVPPWRISK